MGYLDRIDGYENEMIEDLKGLLAIPGVAGDAEGDMPFGKEVHEAFIYMLRLAEEEGFETFNADNYGGHIEFGGYHLDDDGNILSRTDGAMGILTHLDVVPAGNDWDYPPFEGTVLNGRIYGRGTIDDKGPTIAAFYAMKALKDEGIMPKKRVRLILGLDEEAGTGWQGMKHYFTKVDKPLFGFTPDAEFPAIHGEMGILIFQLAKKIGKSKRSGIELTSLTGGNAPNMVADSARAVLRGESYQEVRNLLNEYKDETGYDIRAKGIGKSLEITAFGVSSHGARPMKGLNAISILLKFLKQLNFANDETTDFINFYDDHIGFDINGERLGCGFRDDVSGKLILNVGMANINSEIAHLTVNIRYPVTCDSESVYEGMEAILDRYDIGVVKLDHQPPIHVPEDDPLIKTLMDVYARHTGDIDSRPLVIGGGTYARAMDNAVAFGMAFPDEPELAHQKNEYILIDNLIKATKIFADSIYELTK